MMSDEPESIEPLSDEAAAMLESMKREALQVGYPRPEEVRDRIPLIGRLGGKAPTIGMLLAAREIFNGLKACAGTASFINQMEDPADFYEGRAVSLRGKGRDELVRIAAGHEPNRKKSLRSMAGGR